MLDQDKLMRLLSAPGVSSGTDLGRALGVSRVAVQKRIQALCENGLPIEAVPGKGYILAEGVRLLNEQALMAGMTRSLVESLELFQSVESTNSHLLSRSVERRRARVCVAETQRAGRGRRGNDWQSAPYRNVMLSLSWGFDCWPENITGLGLAVALSIAEYLNESYGLDVKIKWPNDLLVDDAKLAGVLIDVAGESSGACNVVVGIGLNVHQPDWSQSEGYRWCDLDASGIHVDRNRLVADLVNGLIAMLLEFESDGFASMVERWNKLSSFAGQRVRVGTKSSYLEGLMQGVDAAGALLVLSDDGELARFSDSNVSVRKVV